MQVGISCLYGGNGENPKDFLELNNYSVNMIYSAWNTDGLKNANSSSIHDGGSSGLDVTHNETSTHVGMSYQYGPQEALAANIFAIILAQQPTEKHPLLISFGVENSQLEKYAAFRKSAGWVESKPNPSNPNYNELKCEFVWDAKASKLTKGSIPCVTTDKKNWIELVTRSEEE